MLRRAVIEVVMLPTSGTTSILALARIFQKAPRSLYLRWLLGHIPILVPSLGTEATHKDYVDTYIP